MQPISAVLRFSCLNLFVGLAVILSPATSAVAESKPFKLGFISILTGPYADSGQGMGKAAELATLDYEAAHPGEEIKFILEDDGADPKKALAAYEKLKSVDSADLILPISTFAIGVLRERVNRQKDLTFILGNEPYDPADDYIYMFSPAAIPAEFGLGKSVATDHPEGKIIVVTSQNEAFFRFARAVRSGTGERAEILEIPGHADLSALALQIKSREPAALVFNGLPIETAGILKELRRLNFSAPLYFDDSIGNSLSDFKTVLKDISFLRDAKILNLASHMDPSFAKRFRDRFGTEPKLWSDYAYDATYLALILRSKTSAEAREWLKTNTYRGVSGDIRFDENGLRVAEFKVIPLHEHPNFKGEFH